MVVQTSPDTHLALGHWPGMACRGLPMVGEGNGLQLAHTGPMRLHQLFKTGAL